jgi:sec-independent protein translocase protein TatA
MGGFSIAHWAIVAIVGMLLLGRGRFSAMTGDLAKGIKEFKKGMSEADEPAPQPKPAKRIEDGAPRA